VEDGLGEEEFLECVKRGLTVRGPIPCEVFLGEVNEWAGDGGVRGDETAIEVSESEEGADVFYARRGGPFGNPFEFHRVHGELAGFHDHSEVFNFLGGEVAFLQFKVEIKVGHSLKNSFGVEFVCSFVGGEDKEVIHVDD